MPRHDRTGGRIGIVGTTVAFALLVTGCASNGSHGGRKVAAPQAEPIAEAVTAELASAAGRAADALQTLSEIEQARTPGVGVPPAPAASEELSRLVTVEWVGPVEPLARRLAERAGYSFEVMGTPPAIPIVVNVAAYETRVIDVLRDMGLQSGKRADLSVDPNRRVVEIQYAAVDR